MGKIWLGKKINKTKAEIQLNVRLSNTVSTVHTVYIIISEIFLTQMQNVVILNPL